MGKIKKVGNFISSILLGNIRDLIIKTKTEVEQISKIVDEMKPDLKDVREKFSGLESKVNTLWADKYAPAHSPRQLNKIGESILNDSGIKDIVDKNKSKLLGIIKEKNPQNPYDAETIILSVMEELPKHCPDVVEELKTGAFKTGSDIDTLLFVGSIYLRNLIFSDLGFDIKELDKKPKDK